ncbi:gamma-glutamyltransferase family protein [Sandaracinobacteroides hominis]|uniref:gamma-glutamyltransferase family protein n=1 Tax=Sandaracinobacteroides hominis TaxID=2780086 RepID=UPI001F210184|nr:gamma-glutamyltransferase family protein [Sandaracinobacteroides hominis]
METSFIRPALLVAVGLALSTVAAAQTAPPLSNRPGDPAFQGRSPAVSAHGMAATAQPLATQAAVEILQAGGSAVDAAIAANAVLGLVEPTGNGIGGDLFALVWDPVAKQVVGLDASGFAPAKLNVTALRRRSKDGVINPLGMDAVTVPGAVAGWEALHKRFGKLPLDRVLAPAVRLAKEGFPLTPVIARGWARGVANFQKNEKSIQGGALATVLYAPGGQPPVMGQKFTNPDLAATLEMIGTGGAAAFYQGAFAADLEAQFRQFGRAMSAADLAAMKAEWVTPISAPYRSVRLWQIPPATQGVTTLQMARIVERFPMGTLSEADRLHLLIEAKKLAFADRAKFLADPRQVKVPVAGLLADKYIAARAGLIRMDKALPDDVPPGDPEEHSDTTYLATADSAGMMVSLIQSNYRGMGSGVVVPRRQPVAGGRGTWGFMLQNRGAQFSLDAKAANVIAPGKRPFHTIIPGMVTKDDGPLLAFGVMGGTMQPQGQVQVLVNLVDLGMNLQAAGDAPRVRHLGSPDPGDGRETPPGVFLEGGIGAATRADLKARGHVLLDTAQDVGGYQAVMWDAVNRVWWGGTEMRKDGVALGY